MKMSGFSLYEHVFPNGKRYIGISKNPQSRWNNGRGYDTQPKVANAIKKYGWDHTEHNVIVDGLTVEQAKTLEMYLISALNTVKKGYNQSIGGDNINSYYLDSEVVEKLKQIHSAFDRYQLEENGVVWLMEEGKTDPEVADLINQAHHAVYKKHRAFTGDERDLAEYLFHINQFLILNDKVNNGEDVSDWKEECIEQVIYNYLFGEQGK